MSKKIRKNDVVTVITGEHVGKSGKVLTIDRQKQRLTVENVNLGRKALRPSQSNPSGGLVERERSLHISNVMLESEYEARLAKRGGTTADDQESSA